ncbi:MAG: alkaline phosphatase family protein [Candidatus Korobacteraceae bacterium]
MSRRHLHNRFPRSVVFLVGLLAPLLAGVSSWAQSPSCTLSTTSPSVTVCTPANSAVVTSPFQVTAGTTDSGHTVTAMKIYLDSVSVYSAKANTLSAPVTAPVGAHHLTVQAWDSAGNVFKQSETITVSSSPSAPTVSIGVSPSTIIGGQSSTLSWSSTGATSAQIDNSIGTVATSGSVTVSPTTTTTYTITVVGTGGTTTAQTTVTVTSGSPSVSITANPTTVASGQSSTLTITATNATSVVITDNLDSTKHTLAATGGSVTLSPAATTIYTVTATGAGNQVVTAQATVAVSAGATETSINHVIFMLQENRTFDTYFGMLNPYRKMNGWAIGDDNNEYDVDGIDDKLTKLTNVNDAGTVFGLFKFATACIDDLSSDWLASYGDVDRYNFTTARKILTDGFVHTAENYAKSCQGGKCGSGNLTDDLVGQRAMGYYDEQFLNYYYYMASQFAVSDRWFSPVSAKSTPNRIATMTGGTTQGLVQDPFVNDNLSALAIPTIFSELSKAHVSWKIYYSALNGTYVPETTYTDFTESGQYIYTATTPGVCSATTTPSKQATGDPTNHFCIDTTHIAPIGQYFTDVANGTLPSFGFIETNYGHSDEHPGSGQSILTGQAVVAKIANALMSSPSWHDSVFFLSYDEGGGPYDHVPPVPGHTNINTDAALGVTTDISSIAVNADSYFPCAAPISSTTGLPTATTHCDLVSHGSYADPGYNPGDAAAVDGFAAQLGFRLPNIIISPFTRRHYVSHTPMDHTAVIKFVENRFIGPSAHLTNRDAAQPSLLEFFDFTNIPWATPPAPVTPVTGLPCTPATMQ